MCLWAMGYDVAPQSPRNPAVLGVCLGHWACQVPLAMLCKKGWVASRGTRGHACPCLPSLLGPANDSSSFLPLRLLQTRFLAYSIGPFHLRLHYPASVASMPPSWLRLGMILLLLRSIMKSYSRARLPGPT